MISRDAQAATTGVLLINLGTPEAPTPDAVRVYLKEFLSDRNVVDLPRLVWWPILTLFVLRTRPQASAARYERIWTGEGSPLRVHTERQSKLLRGYIGERTRAPLVVDFAMRYGKPSILEKLRAMQALGCNRILLLPLYPQYSRSATASALEAAHTAVARMRTRPEIRTVHDFHDDRGYIAALAASVRDYWEKRGRSNVLVMSFHGIPQRESQRGDPYEHQCRTTAGLLAQELGLEADCWRASFQSRFGRAEWLRPYTSDVLTDLGRARTGCVDVICPGFVSDCLETLEEIAIENKDVFLDAGGREFRYIPCLNERHEWIRSLTDLAARNLLGWIDIPPDGAAAARLRSPIRGAGA